ncbi:MAG TPA: cytochrome c peroxidase [Polyangiaceae bacterium]|nr:cytochrome c peroxidase [Polyangiaceae bacterium]
MKTARTIGLGGLGPILLATVCSVAAAGACGTTPADEASQTASTEAIDSYHHRGPEAGAGDSGETAPAECVHVDLASILPGGAHPDPDVLRINAEIAATEASALQEAKMGASLDTFHRLTLLGTLELYDVNLSVNRNVACVTCHDPEAGFTGASSLLNSTTAAQPGSVPITNAIGDEPNYRISNRKPQSYGYAAFAPILHYNATQGTFYGGNFWDMRATGTRLGNPAAEQAEGPPLNPVEMAFPDSACAVYRLATGAYRRFFELVYGRISFAIDWPRDIEEVCSRPGPAPANDPFPVHLRDLEREISNQTFDHMAMAMALYEASPSVSPFSSKFDFVLAGASTLSDQEQRGWDLFHGKANCNQCHLDGTATGQSSKGFTPADLAPLFTDFTPNNIGIPRNGCLPWYEENRPDQFGFTANPAGAAYIDDGFGAFLSGNALAPNPNPTDWAPLAPTFNGLFRTPTLRNVDKRPRPDFVKDYMHNGYLKSLKEVVHFYNTSQALPRCPQGSPGEKVTCWPLPEVPSTLNTTQLGNLHLTDDEEDDVVAFLRTLTDGFVGASGEGGTDAAGD